MIDDFLLVVISRYWWSILTYGHIKTQIDEVVQPWLETTQREMSYLEAGREHFIHGSLGATTKICGSGQWGVPKGLERMRVIDI